MTWISAGSVGGSYLNLFVKTRGITQTPQEFNLSFISITSRFHKLRQHFETIPAFQGKVGDGLKAKIMKAESEVLWRVGMAVVLVNFFNLLVKFWKIESVSLRFQKNKRFMSLSLILTGLERSKEGKNKSEVEQAKVKIPHRACNELSNHQLYNTEHGGVGGGRNHGHIRAIKSQQAPLPYF